MVKLLDILALIFKVFKKSVLFYVFDFSVFTKPYLILTGFFFKCERNHNQGKVQIQKQNLDLNKNSAYITILSQTEIQIISGALKTSV